MTIFWIDWLKDNQNFNFPCFFFLFNVETVIPEITYVAHVTFLLQRMCLGSLTKFNTVELNLTQRREVESVGFDDQKNEWRGHVKT